MACVFRITAEKASTEKTYSCILVPLTKYLYAKVGNSVLLQSFIIEDLFMDWLAAILYLSRQGASVLLLSCRVDCVVCFQGSQYEHSTGNDWISVIFYHVLG